ncbi:MAG: GatB/YqeY domain-containing protein [Rhodobacteraceae bacterium]|nr:GatB/YqeY domain-containing protein [Paracoccaceae bacterium]
MRDVIMRELKAAEAGSDKVRRSMLRLINIAITDKDNLARAAGRSQGVSDEVIRNIISTMIQQRVRSAVNCEEHGQLTLAEGERGEIAILQGLLPKQLSGEEAGKAVLRAIRETQATSVRHKGRVMSVLKSRYPGQMDFRKAGEQVVAELS